MYVKVHYDTPSFFLQTSPQAKAPINITAAILPEKKNKQHHEKKRAVSA